MIVLEPVIQGNVFGHKLTYGRILSGVPTKNEVIFCHGQGEIGPASGSEIYELYKHGWPKHAKSGFEFPFNITVFQATSSYANSAIVKYLPSFVKLKYGAEVIQVTGLSMGGYATFNMQTWDELGLIYAIAPVCGGGSTTAMKLWPEVNGWVFHGDQDTTVKYQSSKGPVDAYNAIHQKQIKYTLYPGVGHNAWDKAYSVTPGQDELLQWVIKNFEEAPRPVTDLESLKAKVIECVRSI